MAGVKPSGASWMIAWPADAGSGLASDIGAGPPSLSIAAASASNGRSRSEVNGDGMAALSIGATPINVVAPAAGCALPGSSSACASRRAWARAASTSEAIRSTNAATSWVVAGLSTSDSIRCSSACTSAALTIRFGGAFSSSLSTSFSKSGCTSGTRLRSGVGALSTMFSIVDSSVSPRNGCTPVDITYSSAPSENRLLRRSSAVPPSCSGDKMVSCP